MATNDPTDFFVFNNESKFQALEDFLAARIYNTIADNITDKNGRPMIGLSFKNKNKRSENRGLILIKNPDWRDDVLEMVESYLATDRLVTEG